MRLLWPGQAYEDWDRRHPTGCDPLDTEGLPEILRTVASELRAWEDTDFQVDRFAAVRTFHTVFTLILRIAQTDRVYCEEPMLWDAVDAIRGVYEGRPGARALNIRPAQDIPLEPPPRSRLFEMSPAYIEWALTHRDGRRPLDLQDGSLRRGRRALLDALALDPASEPCNYVRLSRCIEFALMTAQTEDTVREEPGLWGMLWDLRAAHDYPPHMRPPPRSLPPPPPLAVARPASSRSSQGPPT